MVDLLRAQAGRRSLLIIGSVAGLLFLCSWTVIHHGFYAKHRIVDTPLYQHYGDWMLHGGIPYRDFSIEYPPGALPVFLLPAIGNSKNARSATESSASYELRGRYRRNFELLMALCGLGSIALAAVTLRYLQASNGRAAAALGLVAISPLLLGSLYLSRFDLWPTLLALASLTAILVGFDRIGFGLLGMATAAKIFPAVLLPIGSVWIWKRRGREQLGFCLAVFLGALLVCFLPFLAVAPAGVWEALRAQLGRPLQIESLGAAVLAGLHHLTGLGLTMESGSGSQNLAGTSADLVALAQSCLQAAALAAIWTWFALDEVDRERLVRASAASLVAFVALGKVLSPQFLIWLCPFVVLVRGRRGLVASALLALSLVATQLWFPSRYWDYAYRFDVVPTVFVVLRNFLLLAVLATLLLDLRRSEQEVSLAEPAQGTAT